jgi:hypothetical protein
MQKPGDKIQNNSCNRQNRSSTSGSDANRERRHFLLKAGLNLRLAPEKMPVLWII